MSTTQLFHLPDLGEGLPDAEIVEWHVAIGQVVKLDEPLVSMETAKAVVEVPAPCSGTLLRVAGKVGYAVVPRGPAHHHCAMFGTAFGIAEQSRKKGASWLYLQWASGKANQLRYLPSGAGSPARTSREGLATWPFTWTRPLFNSSVASERVLWNRAAHSHLSMRSLSMCAQYAALHPREAVLA